MRKKPRVRIAWVKFSPKGRSYPMRCDREDIYEGHAVEMLRYADSERAYYDDGVVTSIVHERWACKSRVVNHANEVIYSIGSDVQFVRDVDLSRPPIPPSAEWHSHKSKYYNTVPETTRNDMSDIYDAISNGDGEDAYVGDGIWISPNGKMEDRGR